MNTHKIIVTLFFSLLITLSWAQPPTFSQQVASKLMGQMQEQTGKALQQTIEQFIAGGADAIPYLQNGLQDPSVRLNCVQALMKIESSLSAPVLIDALEKAPLEVYKDQFWFAYLAGAVGRTGEVSAVPVLRSRYLALPQKDLLPGVSLAWAINELTGEQLTPATDPWKQAF